MTHYNLFDPIPDCGLVETIEEPEFVELIYKPYGLYHSAFSDCYRGARFQIMQEQNSENIDFNELAGLANERVNIFECQGVWVKHKTGALFLHFGEYQKI